MTDRDVDLESLSAREREVLRAVWQMRSVGAAAQALDRSSETIKTQLRSARIKLGASNSMQAARMLALAEEPHLLRGNPAWGMPFERPSQHSDSAADVAVPAAHDSAGWSVETPEVPLDRPRSSRDRGIVSDALGIAVQIAALLAIVLFAIHKLPDVMHWNLFEP